MNSLVRQLCPIHITDFYQTGRYLHNINASILIQGAEPNSTKTMHSQKASNYNDV